MSLLTLLKATMAELTSSEKRVQFSEILYFQRETLKCVSYEPVTSFEGKAGIVSFRAGFTIKRFFQAINA